MKRLLLAASRLLVACETSNKYGECYGLANEEDKRDDLVYHPSTWNAVMGVIFVETVFAPIIAFGWNMRCPTGHKAPPPPAQVKP